MYGEYYTPWYKRLWTALTRSASERLEKEALAQDAEAEVKLILTKDRPALSFLQEVERIDARRQQRQENMRDWLNDLDVQGRPKFYKSDTAMVVQADLWLAWRDEQVKLVESLRRDRHSMGATPIPGIVDYAAAAQAVTLGLQALDEGIPNGQKLRVEAATVLIQEGLKHLIAWLEVKGYDASLSYRTAKRTPAPRDPLEQAIVDNDGKFTI